MTNKQNLPRILKKQGTFYQLNLIKNNGPFLSKDIMHNNQKSISLLTSNEVISSHTSMLNTLRFFNTNKKSFTHLTAQPENIYSTIQYIEGEIFVLGRGCDQLKVEQKNIKKQMDILTDTVSKKMAELLEQFMPVLKKLIKKVKELNNQQNAQLYKISKELNSLEKNNKVLSKEILNYQRAIEDMELIIISNNKINQHNQ